MIKHFFSIFFMIECTFLWSEDLNSRHYLGNFNYKSNAENIFVSFPCTLDLISDSYHLEIDVAGIEKDNIKHIFQPAEKIKKSYGLDVFYESGKYQIQETDDVTFITFKDEVGKPFIEKAAVLYNDDLCFLFDDNCILFSNDDEIKSSKWKIIRSVSSSSFLKEKNVVYDGSTLMNCQKIIPWVEGNSDYGIGEWIEFEFYEQENISGFIISNGFVSYEKPYLYRQNSRIEKVSIETDKGPFSQNILLEDKCQLQKITFDKPVTTKYIKLTIMSVYSGKKWKDTCLSRIIFF